MNGMRAVAVAIAYLITFTSGISAADDSHEAGLVVRHGDGATTFAIIRFEDGPISGIDLLRQAGVSLVSVEFGGLGSAVCSIDGEGCGVESCRTSVCQTANPDSPYWRYFRLNQHSEWEPVPLGASSRELTDGDVDGWSWTSDESHLPSMAFEEIAIRAGYDAASTDSSFSRSYSTDGMLIEDSGTGQPAAMYAIAAAILLVLGGVVFGGAAVKRRGSHE